MNKLMMMTLAVVLAVAVTAFGQTGSVSGRITERSTGQGVPGAIVSTKDHSPVTAGADGTYSIDLKPGVYNLSFTAKGFAPIIRNQIAVTGGRDLLLDVKLDVTLSEHVEVRSSVFAENAEQTVSNLTLDREPLRQTPGSGGDILRALSSLPGVTSIGAEFGDLIVRGGTTEENLVYVDRIPIDDFTYFTDRYDSGKGGRASVLSPDVFDKTEFSTGGFGARYGDKMSSALDVTIREAVRERLQGVIFADSGTAGSSIDIPLGKKGSWMVSARRSYIDIALAVAGIADLGIIGYPATYDLINKGVYDFTPKEKLVFTAINSIELFRQTDKQAVNIDRRTDRFRMRRTSHRAAFGLTLNSTLNEHTLAQSTIWYTSNHNDGSFYLPNSNLLQRARDLRDSRLGVKEDVSVAATRKVDLAFGGGLYFDQANYHTFENVGTNFSPLEEEFKAPARDRRLESSVKASAYGYIQAALKLSPRFTITPGVRTDHYGLTGETLVSPRFAARFNASERVSLTFATGTYRQPPSLFVMSLATQNRDLRTQRATHFIGGIEYLIDANTRLRAEVYRKNYDDLIIQPVRPTANYVINGQYFNSGRGDAEGIDISLLRSLTGKFSGQASYSFTRARRSFDAGSRLAPADLERPHQLVLIGIYRFFGFNVAGKYRLASGLPYTRRTAVRITPGVNRFFQRIVSTDDINALRFPTFASLDLRAERRFVFKKWSLSPYIDYFNITNHRSVVSTNYEFSRVNPQLFSEDQRFPIFGLRVEF